MISTELIYINFFQSNITIEKKKMTNDAIHYEPCKNTFFIKQVHLLQKYPS